MVIETAYQIEPGPTAFPHLVSREGHYADIKYSEKNAIGIPSFPLQLAMASAQPFVLRWGIISTGKISAAFVRVSDHIVQMDCILLTKVPTGRPRRSQDVGEYVLVYVSCFLTCSHVVVTSRT